jgi:hypothetical protein
MAELDKRPISKLPEEASPSTSAVLVGVDEGETVKIPITEFAKAEHEHSEYAKTSNIPSLEGYAKTTDLFSKDYNDLKNKPSIPSIAGLASTSYVDTKVAGIVNSAPAALDTLNELSKALGNDANFSATVATQIGNKVDKANGKGLSTNDYTTAEKNKLAGIAEGANNYSHPETHPASMITGLSKVATSGSYNDLADKPSIPSGGGASIIYATEKPSTPQQAIYVITEDEVVKVELYQSQILPSEMAYCEIVDALPEIGNPAMDLTTQALYTYYLTTDGELYGYVDAALEAAGGVPVGWYPVAPLFGSVGTTYGGKITSTDQATDASTMYALLTKAPKTRVYVPLQDGAFLELTSGVRTRFDEYNGNVSITEV